LLLARHEVRGPPDGDPGDTPNVADNTTTGWYALLIDVTLSGKFARPELPALLGRELVRSKKRVEKEADLLIG
jgi:hypothetical protein